MNSVLTATEINDLWNESKNPDDFARAIERAVLAKAVEQDPIGYAVEVYYQSMIDPADCGEGLEIYPVDEFEKLDRSKDDENVFPVYAHPPPHQAIPEWQPIETAPKDHKAYLAYCPENQCIYTVFLSRTTGNVENFWRGYKEVYDFSHWMPLPEPPKS